MAAISTVDQAVAALPGQRLFINKASQTAEGAGTWHSLWRAAGFPVAGAVPPVIGSGGGVPDRTTDGALPLNNAASPPLNLLRAEVAGTTPGTLILYDRLWACSGFVGNVATSQAITSPSAVNRPNTNGDDVELWGEVYSAMGATGATFTATYTNQANVGSKSATYVMPSNALSVGQMVPFTLAAGDTGVRSVQSLILNVSTGTAGNFGLTLLRRICEIPLTSANIAVVQDLFSLGKPAVDVNACVGLMVMCTTTNTGLILGTVNLGE